MFIKAYCPKCKWVGHAEVGKLNLSIANYKCPKCGHPILKRPYRGVRDLCSEEAKLKEA